MAEVLPNLQKLKVINFGDCLVKSEGARAIADAIKESHQQLEVKFCKAAFLPSPFNDIGTLQEINLSYDELDQDDALAVAEALENKKRLKKIELNGTYYAVIKQLMSCIILCSLSCSSRKLFW